MRLFTGSLLFALGMLATLLVFSMGLPTHFWAWLFAAGCTAVCWFPFGVWLADNVVDKR